MLFQSRIRLPRLIGATLLHACVILPKSTHTFHPAHARCGDLPFYRPTHSICACLQPAGIFMTYPLNSDLLLFFKGYIDSS